MTNLFKETPGKGGYGSMYKGKLLDGHLVAVKLLHTSKGNGQEFINEVARRFTYKENTNLKDHQLLTSEELYQISIGIAQGLEYLHRGYNTRILHFDIKPHNILLDENFYPENL
ncbi:Protein kinase domain - like 10 [Theobroma cacao]|nr:Protein kinase domain - like 10 [Theobroma cacao]